METKKVAETFFCEKCNYKTSKISNWKKHLLTRKHLLETTGNTKVADSLMECKICNKPFKTRAGLWKHEQKCQKSSSKKEGEKQEKKKLIDETVDDEVENAKKMVEKYMADCSTTLYSKNKKTPKNAKSMAKSDNQNFLKNGEKQEKKKLIDETMDDEVENAKKIVEKYMTDCSTTLDSKNKKTPKNAKSMAKKRHKKSVENEDFERQKNEALINEIKKITKTVNTVMENQNRLIDTINNQQEIINDLVPKVGQTNNFNINVFLNETCKNAINMSDFVKSLQIKFEDLNYTKEKGLIEGVTSVMVNGLKELKMDERPIHCMDSKRDVLYIKDNDSWEKESENNKLTKSISDIVNMERRAINEWVDKNPDWEKTEEGRNGYLNLVKTVMSNDLGSEESRQKVIKNIAKETIIDKNEI